MKRLALFGITGRMGQAVVRALADSRELVLSGALTAPGDPRIGQPVTPAASHGDTGGTTIRAGKPAAPPNTAGGSARARPSSPHRGGEPATLADIADNVSIVSDVHAALRGAQVALDFSRAEAVEAHLAACVTERVPLVVAVTGLPAATQQRLQVAAREIAVLSAANTSLAVAVMSRLAALAAGCLPQFEVEITEAHHRMKRDAPSGTALKLGEAVAQARGRTLAEVAVYARHGQSEPRPADAVGFSVIRAGDIVGTHTVLLAGEDETLQITHQATDRACFARGALAAAAWLAGRAPGLYRMEDVLGF